MSKTRDANFEWIQIKQTLVIQIRAGIWPRFERQYSLGLLQKHVECHEVQIKCLCTLSL